MITEERSKDGTFVWKRGGHYYSAQELVDMVVEWYGGECSWCGIDDYRVLTIDHVHPRGHPLRIADNFRWHTLAKWIIRNVVYGDVNKDAFRVLCRNCNWLAFKNRQENPGHISWGPCNERNKC